MFSHLLHSHLLQSLGNAIIHSLWQALVLLLVYKVIVAAKKDLQPAVKHNLSAILVILTFGWFAYTFQDNYLTSPAGTSANNAAFIDNSGSHASSLINIPTEMSATLSIAYLVLLSFLMSRLIFSIIKTLRIHTANLVPADEFINAFTHHASAVLKIQRKVTVWIGRNVSVPATVGFLKPVILLPAVCITHLSPQQIEAIILHELSHIRRNDFVLNLVLVTIETLLFFNPAVFIFMKTIREERENCCDDLVLKNNYEPLHYAKALLAFSKEQLRHQELAMNAASRTHQLFYRIKRITGGDLGKPVHFSGRIALFALIAMFFFSFAAFENQSRMSEKISPVVVEAKIENNNKASIPLPDKNNNQTSVAKQKKYERTTKEAPVKTSSFPQLAQEISASVKELINEKSLHPEIVPDEKTLVAIGKNATEQINRALSQLPDKKLQALILQQKELWNEKRIQEELKAVDIYKKEAEKFLQFKVTGDSVYFHSEPANFGKINGDGNRISAPLPRKKVIMIPEGGKTFYNFNAVKRLRTADI